MPSDGTPKSLRVVRIAGEHTTDTFSFKDNRGDRLTLSKEGARVVANLKGVGSIGAWEGFDEKTGEYKALGGSGTVPRKHIPELLAFLKPKQGSHRDSTASRAQGAPGWHTQDRWRIDPQRQTLWNWSRVPRKPLSQKPSLQEQNLDEVDTILRLHWAKNVAKLGVAITQRQGRLLNASDVRLRRKAARILGIFGTTAAVQSEMLVHALGDGDSMVRERALWALGQVGEAAATQARNSLRKFHPLSEKAVEAVQEADKVLKRLEESDRHRKERNGTSFARISSSVFRFTQIGSRTTSQVSNMGGLGGSKLSSSSSAPAIANHAPKQLPMIAHLDERLNRLKRDMGDDDPGVRYKAVRLICQVGVESIALPPWELVAHLAVLLDDSVDYIWEEAARLIAKMAVCSHSHLAHRLGSDDVTVRREAMQSLLTAGVAAAPEREAIEQKLKDPDGNVRKMAALSLSAIGKAEKGDFSLEAHFLGFQPNDVPDEQTQQQVTHSCKVQSRKDMSWRIRGGHSDDTAYQDALQRLQKTFKSRRNEDAYGTFSA